MIARAPMATPIPMPALAPVPRDLFWSCAQALVVPKAGSEVVDLVGCKLLEKVVAGVLDTVSEMTMIVVELGLSVEWPACNPSRLVVVKDVMLPNNNVKLSNDMAVSPVFVRDGWAVSQGGMSSALTDMS